MLKRVLRAFSYQASGSDRRMFKCGLIFVCAIALIIFLFFWNYLWSPKVRGDSRLLDSLIASKKITGIEIISSRDTNVLTGDAALKLLASLDRTNRVSAIDYTKDEGRAVSILSGTNRLATLWEFDSGVWMFRTYGFRLRQ